MRDVTKRNFRKVLIELNTSKYCSLPVFLVQIREKLLNKETLTVSEELMSFPRLKKYFEEYEKDENRYLVGRIKFDKFSHRPLKPYQESGVKFLLMNDRCILADDTGLGKSATAIIAALFLPEDYKVLVVTMKTLKYNIETEVSYYSDSYTVIEKTWDCSQKFTIIHYESLKKWKTQISEADFDCIIGDEIHLCKNSKVGRSKNFYEVTKEAKRVWLLTGTPMNNRPIDYFNLLKLIKHPLTRNWVEYVETFCDGYKKFGAWNVTGASNLEILHERTKDSVLRRLKKDYLKDLPSKDRVPVYLKLQNKKEYKAQLDLYKDKKLEELAEELSEEEFNLIQEGYELSEMTKLIVYRKYCALQKIEDGSLVELINTHVEGGSKIVVFTNFTKVVDAVYNYFGDKTCRFIDGRVTDAKERINIVKEFNDSSELQVLVCNLKVGSVGLNIQSANIGIINDLDWVPATMLQAEDRMWRLGQLKEVTIFYPIYKGTVEEVVYKVINEKMRNISTAIEGKREAYFENANEDQKIVMEQKNSILAEIFAQLD